MKMLLRGLMVAAVAFLCVSAAQAQQVEITVDKDSTQSGSLGDFPVLVKLNNARTNNYTGMAADGSNLAFYQGGTPLAYEIENFDNTGTSNIWVRVLTADNANPIVAKWGAGQAATRPTTDVWSNGYIGVYHLNETAGTAIFDSTAGATNGVVVGSPTVNAVGQINGGMAFDGTYSTASPAGSDDAVGLGDNFEALLAMTAEGWAKAATERVRNGSALFAKGDSIGGWWATTWHMETDEDSGWVKWQVGDDLNDATISHRTADGALVPGTWQYFAGTWDGGTTSSGVKVYVDGVDESAIPGQSGNFVQMEDSNLNRHAVIGAGLIKNKYEGFEGDMDEVRFSDVERSADWLMSSYLSGADNYLGFANVVPEPASLALLGGGGLLLLSRRRRRA